MASRPGRWRWWGTRMRATTDVILTGARPLRRLRRHLPRPLRDRGGARRNRSSLACWGGGAGAARDSPDARLRRTAGPAQPDVLAQRQADDGARLPGGDARSGPWLGAGRADRRAQLRCGQAGLHPQGGRGADGRPAVPLVLRLCGRPGRGGVAGLAGAAGRQPRAGAVRGDRRAAAAPPAPRRRAASRAGSTPCRRPASGGRC